MIAELILMLAGHPSSLFLVSGDLNPVFTELLHPGEQKTLEYLSKIALRYRKLKEMVDVLGGGNAAGLQKSLQYSTSPRFGVAQSQYQTKTRSSLQPSEYISAMCSAIRVVLQEYETLVVNTEARVLQRDDEIVASGSFVPLASLKAIFAEWDAPMAALHALVEYIHSTTTTTTATDVASTNASITPGKLIDLLLERSTSGVARVASIMSSLALAVQRVWRMHLITYLVHGSVGPPGGKEPFAHVDHPHRLNMDMMPRCVSPETRESIVYVGRAVMTVKAASATGIRTGNGNGGAGGAGGGSAVSGHGALRQQLPRSIAVAHSKMLARVLPQDGREFDVVMAQIRANISEWLWTTVLTRKDVDEAIESLYVSFNLCVSLQH